MANTVTLVRRVKTAKGWRRYSVVYGGNGRVRPGYVDVEGKQVFFEGGSYELRYYVDRQAKYEPAGHSASEALAKRERLERKLNVQRIAGDAGLRLLDDEAIPRPKLEDRLAASVTDALKRNAPEAAQIARLVCKEFLAGWTKTYVDEVTREDIFAYHAAMRRRGNSDRTVANKHVRLMSAFHFAGVEKGVFPPKPKFERALPTIYDGPDVGALLEQLEGRFRIIFSTLLMCGLRERELSHLMWSDINQRERTLRVQGKAEYGFRVKDSEQRDVPIPDRLFEEIKAWHAKSPEQRLLFPARNGKPDGHVLRQLKGAARDAGLNCGSCAGCRRNTKQECSGWTLHKFRRSYLTTLLRSGIDLRTAQAYAGHSDLASTMRYLRPASGEEARAKVNAVRWY